MKALISGEAGMAALLQRNAEVRHVAGGIIRGWDTHDVARVFDGCTDVKAVEVRDAAAADRLARNAWAFDRALRLFLFLIDPAEPEGELRAYARCCEELLAEYPIIDSLEARLMSAPVPVLLEVNRIESAAVDCSRTLKLFHEMLSVQNEVTRVREAFESVWAVVFGGEAEKHACLNALVETGSIRDVVLAFREHKDLNFLHLNLLSRHRKYADGIRQWISASTPGHPKLPRVPVRSESEDSDDYVEEIESGFGGRRAFENVRIQQAGIIDRLNAGDLSAARAFAEQMVESQKVTSDRTHIAKSLTLLSQRAKELGLSELQLEWAERANEFDPLDPVTSGQLADALIGAGQIAAAFDAIEETEKRGGQRFAGNMRARILRMEGHFEEARALYLKISAEFETDPEVWHSYLGAAECLRDMERFEEALAEYSRLVDRWPSNPTLRSGLASVYMDLGRFHEAVQIFGDAIRLDHTGIVPRNGRATAYKLAGNFDEALRLYDEILQQYPNEQVSLCGRAEVLRYRDDLEEALIAYDVAISRVPWSPVAISGKADVLTDLGRYSEAEALFAAAELHFPLNDRVAAARANLLRRRGRYVEAVRAFDRLAQRFPFNRWIKWARADALRRMGNMSRALRAFDLILHDWPDYELAATSKASILITMGRLDEAKALMPDRKPLAAHEWTRFVLRAFIIKQEAGLKAAIRSLRDVERRVPFARERRFIRATIAALELQRSAPAQAVTVAEFRPGEITNVIFLHALAASKKKARAQSVYEQLLSNEAGAKYTDLASEVARRIGLIQGPPKHSPEWILKQEEYGLLAEAL